MSVATTWHCGKFDFDLTEPIVMGVCNVTPDSFSDGGDHNAPDAAVAFALQQVEEGAVIIDVGGESTRPGSTSPSTEEEIKRTVPVVKALAEKGIAVSIDTRHAEVAQANLDAGACIINDVSGFRDKAMREVAEGCDAGLVIMHMLGEPGTMQDNPVYEDVVGEIEDYLLRVAHRLEKEGVASERICIDPGPGFGKTVGDNQKLLEATGRLADNGYPYLIAVSRKSYIGAMTGIDEPKERDRPSALCAAAACEDGGRIVRAHNVALTCEMLRVSRRAIIGLGSNVGNPVAHLDNAVAALRQTPDTWVYTVSPYVKSEPAYLEDQAEFVNAVAVVQTTLSPEELLVELHKIEEDQGRVREIENGPRTLDLDIEDYEGEVSERADLALPHPKLLERDFVVTPLLTVLPHYVLANGVPVTRDAVSVGKITGLADNVSPKS